MSGNGLWYWLLYFIVTLLIGWLVLSLIILWVQPVFTNEDGSINWWTTLWVAFLIIIFSWLFIIILMFIVSLFRGDCEDECGNPTNMSVFPGWYNY